MSKSEKKSIYPVFVDAVLRAYENAFLTDANRLPASSTALQTYDQTGAIPQAYQDFCQAQREPIPSLIASVEEHLRALEVGRTSWWGYTEEKKHDDIVRYGFIRSFLASSDGELHGLYTPTALFLNRTTQRIYLSLPDGEAPPFFNRYQDYRWRGFSDFKNENRGAWILSDDPAIDDPDGIVRGGTLYGDPLCLYGIQRVLVNNGNITDKRWKAVELIARLSPLDFRIRLYTDDSRADFGMDQDPNDTLKSQFDMRSDRLSDDQSGEILKKSGRLLRLIDDLLISHNTHALDSMFNTSGLLTP